MVRLTRQQESIVADVVDTVRVIEGIEAIVLGGSFARGRARADSDLDIGIYYRETEPFSIAAIRRAATHLSDSNDPIVTGLGEWGPWVDGGAWLTIQDQRVDLLYRSVERVESVIRDANAGKYELHYTQQPPFGFFSPTYLGEVFVATTLFDPHAVIERLKAAVAEYPQALRRAVIQNCLWGVEFGLTAFAPKFARSGDAYGMAGCLARFTYYLVLALFALNGIYLLNDKTALLETREFALAPASFAERAQAVLGNVGLTPAELRDSQTAMFALFSETVELAGSLYRPNRLP